MLLCEIISGARAPLFHNMRVDKALDVFVTDRLVASWTHRVDGQSLVGISMSRNPRLGRSVNTPAFGPVQLKFNHDALRQDHRIIPLDAEQALMRTHNERGEGLPYDLSRPSAFDRIAHRSGDPLAEEFVIGDIEPLHPYLDEILIVERQADLGKSYAYWNRLNVLRRAARAYARRHGIRFRDINDRRYRTLGISAKGKLIA